MSSIFTLRFSAFCGMPIPIIEASDREYDESFVRMRAAQVLRDRRASGHTVSILERGRAWECLEPEDSFLIPDTAGTLHLEEVSEFAHLGECQECGSDDDWRESGNDVYCGCQACPGCGEPGGWHASGCTEAEETDHM